MKTKRFLAWILTVMMCAAVLPSGMVTTVSAKPGDADNPYKISTEAELIAFAAAVNGGETSACAILTKDITCTGDTWTPIGTDEQRFNGTFDGNGYKITGLSDAGITPAPTGSTIFNNIGFDGTVKNLTVEHGNLIGWDKSGIAFINYGTIKKCINTGAMSVTGENAGVCGIAHLNNGTIEECMNTGALSASGKSSSASGIAKENYGTIKKCINTGALTVTGDLSSASGIVNTIYSEIEECANTGALSASGVRSAASGIAGSNIEGWVTDCINTGEATATNNAAGIICDNNGWVENCINIGATSANFAGSIIQDRVDVESHLKNCRSSISLNYDESGENVSQLSAEDFAKQESFPFLDFEKIWVMGEEYPVLRRLSHTVTFYANNGSSDTATQAVVVFTPTALKKNGFSYSEHEFEGWSTTAKGDKVYDDKETVTVSADLELYAKWNSNAAVAPTIKEQPKALKVTYGYTNASFSVTAEAAEGHTLSYQWYQSNSEKTYSQAISGATSAEYAFPTGKEVGYQGHYYCVVRATKGDKYAETETDAVLLEVKQKTLTITPDDKQKEYGDPDPEFTAKVEGLVGDDAIEYTLSRIPGEEIMNSDEEIIEYPINVNIDNNKYPNYIIVKNTGKLTISKKTVTAKAVDKEKVYGDPDPEMEYVIDGVSEKDKKKFGKITLSRAEGDDVGSYAITLEADVTETENYKVTCVPGALTITPKPVTVTADEKQMVYGGAAPEFTVTAEGLVGNDEIKDCTAVCPKYGNNVSVGDYEIVVQVKTASNPNYTVTANPGKLTINPKPITVTADAKEKVYGDADPELTVTAEGLVGTDKVENYTVSREEGDSVGEYAITVQFVAGANSNYAVTANPGTLTINPKLVTVTADNKEKIYGEVDPILTATVSGTLGTDSVSYTLSRAANENFGEYEITPSGDAEQGNYALTFETGKFKINKRPATITVKNAQKLQGSIDPEFAATVEGTVAGDALDYTLSREEGENEGRYAINAVLGSNPNYEITTVSGELSIEVVRASSRSSEHKIEKKTTENGEITLSDKDAKPGDTVIITATPKDGFELEKFVVTDANRNNIEVTMNEDGTGSFKMPDSAVSIGAVFVPKAEPTVKFADVSEDSWYYEYVEYVTKAGLMVGTSDDTFEPDAEVSRAMVVTILYRMDGMPEVSIGDLFDDVEDDSWYAAAVAWAAENNIISGIDENNFGHNLPITREQFAAILYRYAIYKGYDTSNAADILDFDDAKDISDWALDAMRWANAEGFMFGRTETTLEPQGETTRAEAAAIFTRFLKWVAEPTED